MSERHAYFFDAYVRVEATSEEEAIERIQAEPTYVAEADFATGPDDAVQLVVTDLPLRLFYSLGAHLPS